ncbi:fluoride efflux transporter FluC [Fructobacillus ficulneus]|uniref:Fluoride-specific ion channel FluC n=1 Tax=Fructobacillus ficulneus TaxID=157463 RepID=A0A0K8MF12_9LACO|nr:CrcB family protein [Fructobacillus ficulneus]GAO99126.1 putative fluoride ion transporter CrcB [Fructobacillus ficulneus]
MVGINRKIEATLVFVGGSLGGLVRYLFSFMPVIGPWPITTVIINWLGAFLLAFLTVALIHYVSQPVYWQSFLGTGVMGGFTTFGTMIFQTVHLSQNSLVLAGLYLLASIFGGMVGVVLGQNLAHKLSQNHTREAAHG